MIIIEAVSYFVDIEFTTTTISCGVLSLSFSPNAKLGR